MSPDSARKIRALATLAGMAATLYDGASVVASVVASAVIWRCASDSESRAPPWLAAIDTDIQHKIRALAALYVGVSITATLYAEVSALASVITSVSAGVSASVASYCCRQR